MSKLLYLLLIVSIGVFLYFSYLRTPQSKAGERAPNFEAELIDQSTFKLSDLEGKYILLDFWGSWCGPCRVDNRKIVQMYEQFNDQKFKDADGFEVVSVALEKNDRHWQKAAENAGFSWKYQIVEIAKFVLLSDLAKKYNVSNLPSKFLINPKGEIVGINQSFDELEKFLRLRLAP